MTKRRIIGLLGPRGVGKDLAAIYIKNLLPKTLVMAFADPIRAMLSEILETPERSMKHEEWKAQEVGLLQCTGRQALNRFGEGMKMLFNREIWVTHWQWRVGEVDDGFNVVVPDVRTELEIEAVLAAGGELWHVCRTGHSYTQEVMDTQPSIRIEDKYLLNYGGMMRFKQNVKSLVNPGMPSAATSAVPAAISGIGPQGFKLDELDAAKPEGMPEKWPLDAASHMDFPKGLDEVLKEDDKHHAGPQFLEGSGHD